MLYRPDAFEPLSGAAWHEARVRDAIAGIVRDADAAFAPEALWPADEWDAWTSPLPLTNLYVGAAGVIWALDALRRRGYAETALELVGAADRALAAWHERPDFPTGIELPPEREAALLGGETGILLAAWRVTGRAELADRLLARARENMSSEADDVMWGLPGTLLAARLMLDWTGEQRWRSTWSETADTLWARRDTDGWWTQRLHGEAYRGLGPPHGLVGNALALLGGRELLPAGRRTTLVRQTGALLARMAVLEDGLANWPLTEESGLVGADGEIRLQWCAGAPGIVTSAREYLDEGLLLAGAELTWRAGPHGPEKGPCICHGTAGNGHACLAVFERTADELWLTRARALAVHALEQVARGRARRGRGRYSLFTGDLGAALYAADCLEACGRFPVLGTLT